MPAIILSDRAQHLVERMDDLNSDPEKLRNTYAQFKVINRLLSGWGRVYSRYVRPALESGAETILDIGCGGGDISRMLVRSAAKDGFQVHITAIDPDARAVQFMRSTTHDENISIAMSTAAELLSRGERFDVVLSNNVLHHLPDTEFISFMDDSRRLAQVLVVHSDIQRDDFAFLAFLPSHLLFPRSYIAEDGLISIRKSYRTKELETLLPAEWTVCSMALFRNLCIYRPG